VQNGFEYLPVKKDCPDFLTAYSLSALHPSEETVSLLTDVDEMFNDKGR
jgi:hypothetical protein